MRKLIAVFVLGAAFAVGAGLLAFYLTASWGYLPANADAPPPTLEKRLAGLALDAAINREMSAKPNPVALTDAHLIEGVKLYAVDCAVCHGAADAKPSHIALGLYQRAPQLAKYGVEDDDDGEVYWKIYHGIRMTGMPGFRRTLTEDQIWKLTLFLKNMDQLPPRPQRVWEAVPSAAKAAVETAR